MMMANTPSLKASKRPFPMNQFCLPRYLNARNPYKNRRGVNLLLRLVKKSFTIERMITTFGHIMKQQVYIIAVNAVAVKLR